MNNKKIYESVGKVLGKKLDRVRSKRSSHYGNQYWRLKVELENEKRVEEILVFKEWLNNESIYQNLENWENYEQKYLFFCQRKPGPGHVYRLIDWKELTPEKLTN